jgi:hypothetical protein
LTLFATCESYYRLNQQQMKRPEKGCRISGCQLRKKPAIFFLPLPIGVVSGGFGALIRPVE